MRIALMLGKMSLGARPAVDLASFRTTPGMTGTDTGFVRIGECLEAMGHDVTRLYPGNDTAGKYDAAIAVNEPDLLRTVDADVRACSYWLNDASFCRAGFDRYCDLFFSPSRAHLEMFRTKQAWRRVEVSQQNPKGVELYQFKPEKWRAIELGCDPERYGSSIPGTALEVARWEPIAPKIPGRVVYCSSPDRGLHHLLQEWPRIKRAAPHATLQIFYRLGPWIQDLASVPYPFPSIEALRARALYINEALGRMSGPEWGITVRDSVSRATIESEMSQAECLAYPCDTVRWSEGFSCTLLEACAARACPVVLETDAFPQVYGGAVPMVARECVTEWGELVIRALKDAEWRREVNERVGAFAAERTWKHTAERMVLEIEAERIRMVAA